MQNVKVDHKEIATGLLEMVETMPESYGNALAVGMLPAPLMNLLDRILADKAVELFGNDPITANSRREWCADVSRVVAVEMLSQASASGKCLV
jgi:hypothetical protein